MRLRPAARVAAYLFGRVGVACVALVLFLLLKAAIDHAEHISAQDVILALLVYLMVDSAEQRAGRQMVPGVDHPCSSACPTEPP